jgi:hypothetical protein
MDGKGQPAEAQFRPLQTAPRPRMIAAMVLGPLAWVLALVVAAAVVARTNAIELGLLIAAGSSLAALLILALIRAGRLREERRYADGR